MHATVILELSGLIKFYLTKCFWKVFFCINNLSFVILFFLFVKFVHNKDMKNAEKERMWMIYTIMELQIKFSFTFSPIGLVKALYMKDV